MGAALAVDGLYAGLIADGMPDPEPESGSPPFWAPTAEPSFPREAFYDAYHIGDAPTREALRDDLAAFVAQVYEDMADG